MYVRLITLFLFTSVLWADPTSTMKLVFEDKFDGKELDLTKWDFSKDNKEGCKVADGKLSLEVSSKDGKPTLWKNATVNCKFRQPYGYFEASIRMIQTKGRHSGMQVRTFFEESAAKKFPAAEINFVTTGETTNTVRPSVKIAEEAGVRNIEPVNSPIPLDGGASYKKFNTYGVLSTPKYFAWYVNTRQVHRVSITTPTAPLYLHFYHNLPEGGVLKNFPDPKLPPEPMQIDWVKIYK